MGSAASNDTNFEYTIGGQVSQTTGNALNLNGLIIPVQFSPWVKDASGPWLQVPFDEFEFECVALRDPVTRQDFCDTVEFVTTDEGVNIAFGNIVLCPSCSLTGDENGTMFTIRHKGGRELDFRAPVIQSLSWLAAGGLLWMRVPWKQNLGMVRGGSNAQPILSGFAQARATPSSLRPLCRTFSPCSRRR